MQNEVNMKSFKKIVSIMALLSLMALQIAPVQAAMIDNNSLIKKSQNMPDITSSLKNMDRNEIKNELISMGLDPVVAMQRIDNMTNEELVIVNERISELPVGSGIFGTLLTVFIVLVITDMLGATDVFPFVKNINH